MKPPPISVFRKPNRNAMGTTAKRATNRMTTVAARASMVSGTVKPAFNRKTSRKTPPLPCARA